MADHNSTAKLIPFAPAPGNVESIRVAVDLIDRNLMRVAYLVNGDIEKLKIPKPTSVRQSDRLWQHTCCEAFIRAVGNLAYYEFNFSPSGEWAAYAFHSYRDGSSLQDESWSPEIVVRCGVARMELDAVVRLDRLSTIRSGTTLRLGLSAVIEASDGTFSYWALKHPAAKPDFHHPDSFALELPFPSQSG